jgi:formate hydrogenlyase transcriptional activator
MSSVNDAAGVQRQLSATTARRSLLLDELFEQVPEAILLLDKAARAVRANREFVRMFGYSQEEVIGKTVWSLIVPNDLRTEAEGFADLIAQGQTVSIETVRMRKDGQRINVSLLEVPLSLPDETVSGYAIYRDITERKLAEELRAEKTREAALRADVSVAFSKCEGELQHERDRLRLLLDLNNRVASNLDLPQFFHAISSELRRVFNCDCVSLALPDPGGANLRLSVLDFPESRGFAREEAVIPIDGSPAGEVFRSGKPLALSGNELNRVSAEIDPAITKGFSLANRTPDRYLRSRHREWSGSSQHKLGGTRRRL